ncbi:hypothetical protein [Helicobacter sp. T3_23-1056]
MAKSTHRFCTHSPCILSPARILTHTHTPAHKDTPHKDAGKDTPHKDAGKILGAFLLNFFLPLEKNLARGNCEKIAGRLAKI